ncbi:uncharacterized protein LOC104899035 [Beta vulgaris subsp. vulgaris]|uniref:uncharacterized protein LOC104899035 n=1 Tax=Beta vulgaris subsp. vulgaris TaxID=3555 RepID=UPI00053F3E90|nr:uncharacterized protein LOC104899035 [Beta vulgaris subsp. vulgaris]
MASDWNLNDAWCPDDDGSDNEDVAQNIEGDLMSNQREVNQQEETEQPHGTEQQEGSDQPPQAPQGNGHHKRRRLSSEDKFQVLCWLLNRAKEGKLKYGSITAGATEFNLSKRCVSNIWNTTRKFTEAFSRFSVATRLHQSGRKRIQVSISDITQLSMGQRSCIRDLSSMLGVSKSTVHRMIKRGLIRPHTNALHPGLKDANKVTRLQWILNLLIGNTPQTMRKYYPMYDFVVLDEKWFYLTNKTQRVYLAQNEKGMYRAASSSKFIPKVMFTACVARPRYNSAGECTFDGKIGIFPFTYQEAAKRSSKNRCKGTMVTKVVESVNQKVTRDMLINQIIPAIKAKWPQNEGPKTIFIQQDNAKAHITQDDPQWQQVYQQDEFTFILLQQPPNSPDLNILDLGFFRSIQSLIHKKMPCDVDKMLEAVHDAFHELDPKTLSNVWLTLQYVMNEVLKCGGGNDYTLPHVNKKKLEALGRLEEQVSAPMWAVEEAWEKIRGGASTSGTAAGA